MDLLVKNCKYKFGLPQKTQTIVNVLKSTNIQILTAINSLGPNYRRSQGLACVEGRPLSRPPANVIVPLIFIKPHNVFHLLSQLTRLKVMPIPPSHAPLLTHKTIF